MECLEIDSCSPSSSCKPCSPDVSESSADHQPLLPVSHKRKAGRKKFKETRHPVFRGVRQRKGNKWVSQVRDPYKKSKIWLGTFHSPQMATRAYDVAVLALSRGKSAALNFPDSASILPRPKSSNSAKDIQTAALAAAEAFSPTTSSMALDNMISISTNIDESRISNEKKPCLVAMQPVENDKENKVLDYCSILDHSGSLETKANDQSNYPLFIDEEALFNMPGLLDSMAEGMLLTSPALMQRSEVDWDDDTASTINIDLWGNH